jgi:epoxyqueuosine reductase
VPGASAKLDANRIRQRLGQDARDLGFCAIGIAPARTDDAVKTHLQSFVANGWHASMEWMSDTLERRADPARLWPRCRSIVMLAMNYGPETDPLDNLALKDRANISVYARNRDYHDVIKGRLKTMADRLKSVTGKDVKVFVDTAPVMEKPLAQKAGLGWQGKHTNLVSREHGSWFFLGSIFTEADLSVDEPETDHCGTCRACLDACPTNAFPEPYKLDARRCISYLTIEHEGPIPHEFRKPIGNRIYGCDDCLAACPWNKFAAVASEAKLKARADLVAPALSDFLALDDAAFRERFTGSPIKRIGRNRFIRNVLIAAGNSGDVPLVAKVAALLRDADALVQATAVWALCELVGADGLAPYLNGIDLDDPMIRDELDLIAGRN